ncbi:MAG TPA: GNAT family N-acetyltransferase [Steroidobacteraceae bacterium]|nr:GNAT family N-acetyltransferase [Steroidobacteraceae bacterium]
MSWDWQWRWWKHHAPELNATLSVWALRSADGQLVGLAPFYLHAAKHRGGFSGARLELIGSLWRREGGVFSEYLDLILAESHRDALIRELATRILPAAQWVDLVISNIKPTSAAARVCSLLGDRTYVRQTDPLEAHVTRLDGDFAGYVRALNGGTRRKLWNQRSRLVSPRIGLADESGVGDFLDQLDRYHSTRWGGAHYQNLRRRFHLDYASAMARQGALQMTTLYSDGAPLSVMYNVRAGEAEYNIQSGFDAGRTSGISPAYLHFGYSIEQACRDGIKTFDFLAGEGRSRQYKRDFLTQKTEVVTIQAIRAPLAWLYRAYDRFRRRDLVESNCKEHDEAETKI